MPIFSGHKKAMNFDLEEFTDPVWGCYCAHQLLVSVDLIRSVAVCGFRGWKCLRPIGTRQAGLAVMPTIATIEAQRVFVLIVKVLWRRKRSLFKVILSFPREALFKSQVKIWHKTKHGLEIASHIRVCMCALCFLTQVSSLAVVFALLPTSHLFPCPRPWWPILPISPTWIRPVGEESVFI